MQRHAEEIQRLPEIYNERLAEIKERTMKLQNDALSFASADKDYISKENYSAWHNTQDLQAAVAREE